MTKRMSIMMRRRMSTMMKKTMRKKQTRSKIAQIKTKPKITILLQSLTLLTCRESEVLP